MKNIYSSFTLLSRFSHQITQQRKIEKIWGIEISTVLFFPSYPLNFSLIHSSKSQKIKINRNQDKSKNSKGKRRGAGGMWDGKGST